MSPLQQNIIYLQILKLGKNKKKDFPLDMADMYIELMFNNKFLCI